MPRLGDFLRSRRSSLHPAELGLDLDGDRRQVSGLRRTELAKVAGVSVEYYTRLEQGRSRNPSDGVLDALADALRLGAYERAHLHHLARPPRATPIPTPQHVRPSVRSVLDTLGRAPAMVLSGHLDVLAWNRPAHLLVGPHLEFESVDEPSRRPNVARMVFGDPYALDLYANWEVKAQETVAHLQLAAGRDPGDARLTALVDELAGGTEAFADLWRSQTVGDCTFTVREYRHRLVGGMVLHQEVMRLADPGLSLAVYGAEPGSSSAAALRRLEGAAEAA